MTVYHPYFSYYQKGITYKCSVNGKKVYPGRNPYSNRLIQYCLHRNCIKIESIKLQVNERE